MLATAKYLYNNNADEFENCYRMSVHEMKLSFDFRVIWKRRNFYLLLLPALVVYSVFVLYPLVETVRVSAMNHPYFANQQFVGFANYYELFTMDPQIFRSFINNLEIMALSVAFNAGAGMLLAISLNTITSAKLKKIYTTLIFWPYVMSTVASGKMWQRILDPYFGPINLALEAIGLGQFKQIWLGNPSLAMFSVWLACWWMSYPVNMLVFYAGLQGIDKSLYEAAEIDGAGCLMTFRHITLPCLRPVILVMYTLITMGAFKIFDMVYVLGGSYTPLPPFLTVLAVQVYEYAWAFNRFGMAAAIAVVLLLIIIIPTAIYLKMQET